ncbi:MAG: glycosyl hydrolase, partial [Acidobacteriota bacterium]
MLAPRSFIAFFVFAVLIPTAALAERPAPEGPATADIAEASWQRHQELDRTSPFKGLEWRSIGPVVQGGRVIDIEKIPDEPYGFLVAYASGGLWSTVDNGVNFEPLTDELPSMIMGDVAIDPNDGDRIWIGTGEDNASRSSYGGVGVFLSEDGGESWEHKGLRESDRIGRIVIDPRDPQRVFVGVSGRLYTEGGERGVYRTEDDGESWELVLSTGDDGWTGIIDMALDPSNPDVIYAAAWHRERRPWDFVESGAGSGIYKSTDGGDTWNRLGGGFPEGEHVGRIGLAVSASNPQIVYASMDNQEELPEELQDLGDSPLSVKRLRTMTEEDFLNFDADTIEGFIRSNDLDTELDAESLIDQLQKGELTLQDLIDELSDANANLFNTDIRGVEVYRSDDGGVTWKRTHERPLRDIVYTYGYYFGQIRVDPQDPDRVFIGGVPLVRSEDGGVSWHGVNQRDVHVDYQAGWIDPEHPRHMWIGNDGGIDASWDGGKSWVKIDRQSTGQFYTVQYDLEEPYNVYGGLQDNGTLMGSSRSRPAIDTWRVVGGGDGMHIEVDPRDNQRYVGFQFGYYFRGDGQEVRPRDALKEPALRYNWQTPIRLSSHNPDILYFGANKLYRSMDRGET